MPSPRLRSRQRRASALASGALALLAALLLAAPASLSAQPRPPASFGPGLGATSADSAFAAVYERFAEGYRTRNVDLVAGLYAVDAYYLQPGDSIARGRPAIREIFRTILRPTAEVGATPGPRIRFEIVDRVIAGAAAYDIGYYRMGPPTADTLPRAGKFVVLWQRDAAGRWWMRGDGYSGVRP